jgi:hypothetical protein
VTVTTIFFLLNMPINPLNPRVASPQKQSHDNRLGAWPLLPQPHMQDAVVFSASWLLAAPQ